MQTPGAPLLTIARTTTNTVAVSWLSPSAGFNLQVNSNTALVSCPSPSAGFTLQQNTNSVAGVQDNGTLKYLIVNPPGGNRSYRLFKP